MKVKATAPPTANERSIVRGVDRKVRSVRTGSMNGYDHAPWISPTASSVQPPSCQPPGTSSPSSSTPPGGSYENTDPAVPLAAPLSIASL